MDNPYVFIVIAEVVLVIVAVLITYFINKQLITFTGSVNVCVRTNPGAFFLTAEESANEDVSMYQDGKIPKGYFKGEYDLINRAEGPSLLKM